LAEQFKSSKYQKVFTTQGIGFAGTSGSNCSAALTLGPMETSKATLGSFLKPYWQHLSKERLTPINHFLIVYQNRSAA